LETHAPGPAFYADRSRRSLDRFNTYAGIWPDFHRCALVSASAIVGTDLILVGADPEAYRMFLMVGPFVPQYLYAVRDVRCG
jgi:hypothetical protein